MIDYNQLSYKDKPFTQVKKYAVHPLSDQGFNQYLSKESYARQFLNKINPKLIEEFDKEKRVEIHDLICEQNTNSPDFKKYKNE